MSQKKQNEKKASFLKIFYKKICGNRWFCWAIASILIVGAFLYFFLEIAKVEIDVEKANSQKVVISLSWTNYVRKREKYLQEKEKISAQETAAAFSPSPTMTVIPVDSN